MKSLVYKDEQPATQLLLHWQFNSTRWIGQTSDDEGQVETTALDKQQKEVSKDSKVLIFIHH